ncbi:MAG: M16 family metallopeptidase [Vicinamibacterales bacterium]
MHLCSLIAVLALSVAPATAQGPDRSHPPATGPAPSLTLPDVAKRTLSNGLPVWVVEQHEVPLVQVNLIVRAGSATDPDGKFGVGSLTAAMLDEGAGGRSSLELADAVDFLGADLGTSSSYDYSAVRLSVPVARLDQALPLMADVVLRPSFPDDELERLRAERLTSFIQARDNPAALAQIAFPRIVYGARHRYGTIASGTPASVEGLGAADLRRFYTTHYRPDTSAIIVVGDTTAAAVLPMLERAFGGWTADGPAPATAPLPAAPPDQPRHIYIVDKPGAAQSQIRIGWVGVPRQTPDYPTLQVLNTILGGSFTSRLNTNLREEHGYAYGAFSAFDTRLAAGPFFAQAGVQTDKTAESLHEFFVELEGIRKPIPADELEKAKNYVALGFPGEFETTGDLARKLEEQLVYGLADDYFETFVGAIQRVTAADVERAAARYVRPDRFAVVVVGDRSVIEPGIKALGLGPITVVPVDDLFK